jgi:hypothetical protein
VAGFAAILVWEEVDDLPHHAALSGWLLLLITGAFLRLVLSDVIRLFSYDQVSGRYTLQESYIQFCSN